MNVIILARLMQAEDSISGIMKLKRQTSNSSFVTFTAITFSSSKNIKNMISLQWDTPEGYSTKIWRTQRRSAAGFLNNTNLQKWRSLKKIIVIISEDASCGTWNFKLNKNLKSRSCLFYVSFLVLRFVFFLPTCQGMNNGDNRFFQTIAPWSWHT